MKKFDYSIIGSGASGLMLAYYMTMDPAFDKKQILLIDKEDKNQNDRTWCFWEENEGVWESIISKKWSQIFFGSTSFSDQIDISPYQYKCIRSKDFYDLIIPVLSANPMITIRKESVIKITDQGSSVGIETDLGSYHSDKVFNSAITDAGYKNQNKYPVLNQHFIGWFVKTKNPSFDSDIATFMDFKVNQKGNTRFMYVLPFSETEALFEYTLFSENVLEKDEYEIEIKKYLHNLGISEYEITEKEQGCIPMTCYEFRKQNTKNVLHIGTVGGWTKPSTGFTFQSSHKKVKLLIDFLKREEDLTRFDKRTKFWYYDLLMLDLLDKENYNGATLFSRLFRKNQTTKILKFLDEETSFVEDVSIMASMPAIKFLKMIWKRIF